jgi:hypothetical protein
LSIFGYASARNPAFAGSIFIPASLNLPNRTFASHFLFAVVQNRLASGLKITLLLDCGELDIRYGQLQRAA